MRAVRKWLWENDLEIECYEIQKKLWACELSTRLVSSFVEFFSSQCRNVFSVGYVFAFCSIENISKF